MLTSLLDLPNELILHISDSLPDNALLALATSCSRTNQLLIATLFQRAYLPGEYLDSGHVGSISFKGDDILGLQALAAARCITSVQHISCDLYSSRVISTWQNYLLAIEALTTLATRLGHLGEVEFNPYFINSRSEEEIKQCVHSLTRFVNTIVRREESALTMFGTNDDRTGGGGPFVHMIRQVVQGESVVVFSNFDTPVPYHLRKKTPPASAPSHKFTLRPLLKSLVNTLTNLLSLPRRLLYTPPPTPRFNSPRLPPPQTETTFTSSPRVSPHSTSLSTTLPPSSLLRLTTLNLHSSYLLRAHFLPYTTELINTAPLHTLSLGGGLSPEKMTVRELGLAHYDWSLILPAFSLHQLSTLRIGAGVDVAVPDLMSFITRHEMTLRTLDLAWHYPRGALNACSAPLLPVLSHIRATPEYILHLLASHEQEHAHEHLQAVTITSDDVTAYGQATFARLIAFLETQYISRVTLPTVDAFGKMRVLVKEGNAKMPVWQQAE